MRRRDWWVLAGTAVLGVTVAAGWWPSEWLGLVLAGLGLLGVWIGLEELARADRRRRPVVEPLVRARRRSGQGFVGPEDRSDWPPR